MKKRAVRAWRRPQNSAAQRIRGSYRAGGRRFVVIVSRFNEPLTRQLLEGALDTFSRHGARVGDVKVIEVPGAFEIPLALKKVLQHARRVDAVLTLSVVIRGRTRHYDQVVTESARGIRELAVKFETPVILGMVTAENVTQAMERVGLKQMNKGREWAMSAIEMANLARALDGSRPESAPKRRGQLP